VPDVLAATISYHAGVIDELIDGDPLCAQDAGAGRSSRTTSTVSLQGSLLTAQDTCGSSGRSWKANYTATSNTLILQGPEGPLSRTYTLVP
jgi:hypothetical protein